MTYQETLNYLYTQLPMFQRSGKVAYKANLDNTIALDKYFGEPHKKYKTIHLAGTNGKGSVSHMIASVLQASGYKVGLYTSPHLKDFRERIKINGNKIGEEEVVEFVAKHSSFFERLKPSFFEMTVALAFNYFAKESVDVAVVEVGLGGRLDSTNIISPELSVITNIGYDHMDLLGDTLEKIAIEKAGVIKRETPVVVGEQQEEIRHVFNNRAKENYSPIYYADECLSIDYSMQTLDNKQEFHVYCEGKLVYDKLKLDLLGLYQRKNVITTLKSIELLERKGFNIANQNIFDGLEKVVESTGLLGRWQILKNNPLVVCDTAHNIDGIKFIVEQIKETPFKTLHIVFGVVNDKNVDQIMGLLPKDATYYFTKAQIPRALDENLLAEKSREFGLKGNAYPSVSEAYVAACNVAKKHDMIFVGGSTFVVAEVI